MTEDKNTAVLARIFLDGASVVIRSDRFLGAALLEQGYSALRKTRATGELRGMYCAIGVCYDCVVEVDGITGQRACITPVQDGMVVRRAGFDENESLEQ